MTHQQATVFADLKRARQQIESMALELDKMYPKPHLDDERNHLKRFLLRSDTFIESAEEALSQIWGEKL
jgi:hypothetical protein